MDYLKSILDLFLVLRVPFVVTKSVIFTDSCVKQLFMWGFVIEVSLHPRGNQIQGELFTPGGTTYRGNYIQLQVVACCWGSEILALLSHAVQLQFATQF